ncbi:hypothetical protein L484_007320 [Morus notabilis]|uniref:PGG domain-containing protein n=1 Tax=Morus notabilis TaxID=981085 RepID=W9S3H0_9ROSA|nr:uncharacterized protein LOC21390725 isoform X3 [Morus notabilis]EXB86897.1 hypothetical protein L484_007320 [Morus notabilis]
MACNSSSEKLKKELFEHIRKGEWNQVVEVHERDREAFTTRIASYTGDTAFLLAISEGKEGIVEKLVALINNWDKITPSKAKEIVGFQNEKGRTSLHAAAGTGSKTLCELIARVDPSLVVARDYKGESPVFRAVRYGRMQVFLFLHDLALAHRAHRADRAHTSLSSIRYCWNDDDQTILHNAIIRENFDLAFQIIHLYKELVNLVDKDGESPLHCLARKPAAFESGSSLRGRNRIIYDCLSIENLETKVQEKSHPKLGLEVKRNPSIPPGNKQTFRHFIRFLWTNAVLAGGSHRGKKESENVDIESHHGHKTDQTGRNTSQENPSVSQKSYFIEHVSRAIPVILGYGDMSVIKKIKQEKEKHVWASRVLDALLEVATLYDGKKALRVSELNEKQMSEKIPGEDSNDQDSKEKVEEDISQQPMGSTSNIPAETTKKKEEPEKETAILLAAKYGVAEIIEKILDHFPMAIYDKDKDSKNIVLIVLENRHLKVLKFLLDKYRDCDHIAYQKVDEEGNTALHYAAMYDEKSVRSWPVPGAALQMQWEIKWHEFVEEVMPPRLSRTNKEGQTPKELFSHTHKGLVKNGGDWLMSTATSCSVVATLIATVAFASSTTAPGGTESDGKHKVKRNLTFELFAISSLVSLCFSVTSLVMFLAILTSRHQEKDFSKELPRKILFGLTSLFLSIASVLVTFCAGHFLIFKDNFKYAVFPVYAVTLLPLCLFAVAQFPLYFDLLLATFWNPFNHD